MNLTKTRNTTKYLAIKELSDENKTYSISALCEFAGIARSAYYNWLDHVNSDNDNLNERIADTITKIHDEHPDMGYRRIRDTLAHDYKIAVNDKRVLRICRKKKIQSYIKHRYNCCTKPASDPAYVAENILNREFKSDMINQKWVTDISEFKYGVGEDDKKGKLYLSIILDLCDRRPVAFVYSTRNDNPLVFDTFDKAVAANPGATPLLHSDRGYQYTSKAFRRRILAAGMTQSIHMRFCDLFISYKIGLKSIKSTIPFTKLPLYRKIFVIILFASAIISGILLIFKQTWASYIPMALGIISLIIFFIIDSMKRNLKVMLQQHYAPYSEKRMNMTINVLKDYGIEIQNFDSLDMLIEEAKQAQIQCDYIAPLKKPFKTLGAIIIPIVAFVAQKIGNAASQDEMITMALQVIVLVLLTFSLIFSLTPIIKDILYRDYNKYDDFIYDLRQIKLFYAKKNATYSNPI